MKMQPYVKMWYQYFGEGKVMGLNETGAVCTNARLVPVCSECFGTDLTWTEMSGEGAS